MNKVINERDIAFDILMRVYKGVFLKNCLGEAFGSLEIDKRGRAFITALCEGVCERQITLDHLVDRYSNVKRNKIKPQILVILRMGIFQLKYMEKAADHGVVNESVRLAKKHGFAPLAGYVNAVLRAAARDDFDPESIEDPGIRYSVPEHLADLFIREYGIRNAEKMLAAGLKKPALYGRVSPGITPEELCEKLKEEGVKARPYPGFPGAIVLDEIDSMDKCGCFLKGLFTIQDLSSQLVGIVASGIMEERREMKVLDLCCAPGGKTTHMAQLLGPGAHILSRDISEKKLEAVRANLTRLGIDDVTTEVFDACTYDEGWESGCDLVLADLPCSGLGVMGRKKDIKYRVTPDDLKELALLQRRILDNAAAYVRPGGYLIYSTCTVNPGENKEQVSYLLGKDLEIVPFDEMLPEAFRGRGAKNGALQLLQGVDDCDGFFISLFRRVC